MAKNTGQTPSGTKPGTSKPVVNTINGTDLDDVLNGTTGKDQIFGKKGDDVINAGAGEDTVSAGDGNDVIIHNINDNIGSKDFYDGNGGNDTLQLVVTQEQYNILQKALLDFNNSDKSQIFDFSSYSKDMNLKIVNIEHITFEILSPTIQFQSTQSITSGKDDELVGTNLNDMLVGGPGNDHLIGNGGDDRLVGGSGNDHLISGTGNDDIIGGAGDDCINAGAGNDVVNGSAGADTVIHFVDENQGFHDYYQDSGTSVQNDGNDKLILVFSDADYAKIAPLITQMQGDFAAAKKNGVVFDFSQYNAQLSSLLGYSKALTIGTKGFEKLEIINETEALLRANNGEECYGQPNHAPVDGDESHTFTEDQILTNPTLTNFKLANASDADGDTLHVDSLNSGTATGTLHGSSINADLQVVINPQNDLQATLMYKGNAVATITVDSNGTEHITQTDASFWNSLSSSDSISIAMGYTVVDGQGGSDTSTQTLIVNGVNDKPVDGDESHTFTEDEIITNPTLNDFKLANASDVDGDTLHVDSLDSGTATGTLHGNNINADLQVVVNPQNDLQATLMYKGNAVATITVDANGTEHITQTDASFWNSLSSSDSISVAMNYTVVDGHGGSDTSVQTLNINGVNDKPMDGDESHTFTEDEIITNPTLTNFKLANASDVDGDTLHVDSLNSGTATGTLHGNSIDADLQVVVNPQNDLEATLTYQGNAVATIMVDANGTEHITQTDTSFWDSLSSNDSVSIAMDYTVVDGHGGSDHSTQTLIVNGIDDNPMDGDESHTFTEDEMIANPSLPKFKLINSSDVDGDTLHVDSLDSGTAIGTLHGNNINADLQVDINPLNDLEATLTYQGNAVATITVDPDGTEHITQTDATFWNSLSSDDKITISMGYTVVDGHGGSDTSTQTLYVNGVNDQPVDGDESHTFTEDEIITNPTLNDFKLANASDVDGDTLHVDSLDSGTATGTLHGNSIDADLQVVVNPQNDLEATLTYQGNAVATITVDSNGTEHITQTDASFWDSLSSNDSISIAMDYTVVDGHGGSDTSTQTLIVNGIDDNPMDGDESHTFTEDEMIANPSLPKFKLINSSDVDGDTLHVDSLDSGTAIGTLHGNNINADLQVDINPLNDLEATLTYQGNAVATITVDPDGTEHITQTDATFWNSLSSDDKITISMGYTVVDGHGGSDTSTQTLYVNGVNDKPVDGDESHTFTEDEIITNPTLTNFKLANASDVDGDTLHVDSLDSGTATGTLHGNSINADLQVVVNPQNDLEATLTYKGNAVATITVDADGTEHITQTDASFWNSLSSSDSISVAMNYTVVDGHGGSDTSTQTLNINGVNDKPVDGDESHTFTEDEIITNPTLTNFKLANASDVDGDTLHVDSLDSGTATGTLHGNSIDADLQVDINPLNDLEATLTYKGNAVATITVDADGTEHITQTDASFWNSLSSSDSISVAMNYTVVDGHGGSDTSVQTLNINGVNDKPVDGDESHTFTEDEIITNPTLTNFKLANASDVDGDTLHVDSLNSGTATGTLHGNNINADLQVVINPQNDLEATLTYQGNAVATITVDSNGTEHITQTDANFWNSLSSSDSISIAMGYTVVDDHGGSDTSTQTLNINGVNDNPSDPNENYVFNEDQVIAGQAHEPIGAKLINSTDPEGNGLSISLIQNVVINSQPNDTNLTVNSTGNPYVFTILNSGLSVGTLTIGSDGSESLVSTNDSFWNSLSTGESVVIKVDYTVSDSHGGTDTSFQTITINGVNEQLIATPDKDAIVYENALDLFQAGDDLAPGTRTGTNPLSTAETDSLGNSLATSVTGGSGNYSFFLDGPGVTSGPGYTMMIGIFGVLKLFDDGTYTYTLTSPVIGPQADNGPNTELKENFTYRVEDTDGQMAFSTIAVNIVDDVPVSHVTNGIAHNSFTTDVYGTLADMGADSDGAHMILSGSVPAGLTSGGVALTYITSPDGSTITAKAGASTVFTLHGNTDGTYEFHQIAPLDLSVITTDLQSSVGAGGPQSAYYFYKSAAFGSMENAADWVVKITSNGLINPSTQGMGVDNNLFQTGETMKFEFDDEGLSSVGGGQHNLTYIAKIGTNGLAGAETLVYTAYYVDINGISTGNSGPITIHPADLQADGTFMVKAADGSYLDYIDLGAGASTSMRITSFTAFTLDDTQPKILNFGYKAIDGDGDSTSGTFTITETNQNTLTGTPSHDAMGGGLGNQVIIGNNGNDILTGGAGNDTFVFSLANNAGQMQMPGDDLVKDLNPGDKLQFSNVLDVAGGPGPDLADLNAHTVFSDVGGDLLIKFNGGGSLKLEGFGNQNIHNFSDLNTLHPGIVVAL